MFNKIQELHFWCQKILPLVYDDSLSYYEVLCKVQAKLNEVINDVNEHSTAIFNIYDFVNKEIEKYTTDKMEEWLNDGTLAALVEGVINNMNLTEEYTSIVSTDIEHYDYNRMINEMEVFKVKYRSMLTFKNIGKSYLGRDIPAIIMGNPNSSARCLIIGNHHAREIHTAQLIMKQIEFYCENWEKEHNGEIISEVFKDAAIYFVPMTNPDGNMLVVHGLASIPTTTPDYNNLINNIKSALENKIRNNIQKNSDVAPTWDLYNDIEWISATQGRIPNYGFREKDLYMWKNNLQGIDLHYNCWESGVNFGAYSEGLADGTYTQGVFSAENEIGLIGWGAAENISLKAFIEENNLYQYNQTIHGRIPLVQWNYELHDAQLRRTLACAKETATISQTRYADITYNRVGFCGYMVGYAYANRPDATRKKTISISLETGWSHFPPINPNSGDYLPEAPVDPSPIANEQEPIVWKNWKLTTLLFLQKYTRYRDMVDKYDLMDIYNMRPQTLIPVLGTIDASGEIEPSIAAGAYTTRQMVQQRINNRVFINANLAINNKGTLADQTTPLVVRASGIIEPTADINLIEGIASRISGYTCPLGDKNNIIITPEITKDKRYIKFIVNNPETGATIPIRPKDITGTFAITFTVNYIGKNS